MQKPYQYHDIPPRTSAAYSPQTTTDAVFPAVATSISRQRHWSLYAGIGATGVLSFVLLWVLVLVPLWTGIQNQWHYGDAKITTLEADVGHGGTSQFVAFVKSGNVLVIEIPQDPSTSHIYTGVHVTGKQPIITLSVEDVNHDGKPDIVVHIQGESSTLVLFNTGDSFSWTEKS